MVPKHDKQKGDRRNGFISKGIPGEKSARPNRKPGEQQNTNGEITKFETRPTLCRTFVTFASNGVNQGVKHGVGHVKENGSPSSLGCPDSISSPPFFSIAIDEFVGQHFV